MKTTLTLFEFFFDAYFNKDFKYCIIQVGSQCDWLAGGGGTDGYKFEDGKWVYVKSYSWWIS